MLAFWGLLRVRLMAELSDGNPWAGPDVDTNDERASGGAVGVACDDDLVRRHLTIRRFVGLAGGVPGRPVPTVSLSIQNDCVIGDPSPIHGAITS